MRNLFYNWYTLLIAVEQVVEDTRTIYTSMRISRVNINLSV